MATKNSSGAVINNGKVRMRSSMSRGMSGIVEAVNGEGRTGRVGFDSTLNDLIKDTESAP